MHYHDSFGQRLKQRRKALELTQDDLARRVGCAIVTIRKIEADELRPSRLIAERLADHVQIAEAERVAFIAHARGEIQPRRNNLPAPTTSLIGRDHEVAHTSAILAGDTRLVTLIGAPGIGKTRLALQVVREIHEGYADGAYFVALNAVVEPDLVLPAIAQTLGLPERRALPLMQQLRDFLHDKQLLLLLDNFEHVLGAAGVLAELLAASPGLTLLITSRAVLHLSGEWVVQVAPLPVPTPDIADNTALATFPAVELFIARAQAVSPGFALNEANASAIAAICIQLDGIPLAIELAAARVRVFSPPTLLNRLERRLLVLTGGAQDLPARQQTLRSTIDWSYQLLEPPLQAVFERLAVFVGGWTLEAAEQVCSTTIEASALIIDHLQLLLDQSLIQRSDETHLEARFSMLETIREYALDQLAASGAEHETRQRHASYYLALAETAEPELQGADQLSWLNLLESEHGNLRAAFEWCRVGGGDVQDGLRLAGAIWIFWQIHNHVSEGRARLRAALVAAPKPTLARAKALCGAGFLARCEHDLLEAGERLQESVDLFQLLGDQRGAAHALNNLGNVAIDQHQYDRAADLCEQSLATCQSVGDTAISAWALTNLGILAWRRDDLAEAARLHSESLALFQRVGVPRGVAHALGNLARVAYERYDYQSAANLYEEALAIFRALDDRQSVGMMLLNLSEVMLAKADYRHAAMLMEQSLALLRTLGNRQSVGAVYCRLGQIAELEADTTVALSYFDQSVALMEQVGDDNGVGRALLGRGFAFLQLDQFADAQAAFAQSAEYANRSHDRRLAALAVCLRDFTEVLIEPETGIVVLERDQAMFVDDAWGAGVVLHVLGLAYLRMGQAERARGCYLRSLSHARETYDFFGIPMRLMGLAAAAHQQQSTHQACRLAAAAEAARSTLGQGLVDMSMIAQDRAMYHAMLGVIEQELEHNSVAGIAHLPGALTLKEALEFAFASDSVGAE